VASVVAGTRKGVIVLGGSAIGVAIAKSFIDNGYDVSGIARDDPVSNEFGRWYQADCADSSMAGAAVEAACGDMGRLDALVLAAATMPVAPASQTTDEEWARALDDSLTSAFYVLRASLPRMSRGGSITAVGSTNSFLAAPGLAAYAAAKAGLDGLIRQVALDYGPLGVRANIVAPALVRNGEGGAIAAGYPLGRVGRPDDVARAVFFLASSDADFITGVTLPVDGGLSMASPSAFLQPHLRERLPGSLDAVRTMGATP